jgi:hypothetical protein
VKLIRNFVLVGVLFASGAFAANLLLNPSFDLGTFNNSSYSGSNTGQALPVGSSSMNNWSIIANGNSAVSLAWLQTGDFGLASEDGSLFLDLTGYNDATPFGGVSQTVSGLTVGGNYALSFWIGVNFAKTNAGGPVTVTTGAIGDQLATPFTTSSSGSGSVWTKETLNFTANSSSGVISLVGTSVPQSGQYIGLDNVDLEYLGTGVPEPAMILPLALAGAFFVLSRRKRARQ